MCVFFFFFKQKTAYEMRISDWSSDVCSSDLGVSFAPAKRAAVWPRPRREPGRWPARAPLPLDAGRRTEDLPLLALPACLSTLETKPWPRFFGALGRMRKSSSRRSLMAAFPVSSGASDREIGRAHV